MHMSNAMVATAISVPLLLAGIYFASSSRRTPESMGRPHGLLQPPVRPATAPAVNPDAS